MDTPLCLPIPFTLSLTLGLTLGLNHILLLTTLIPYDLY